MSWQCDGMRQRGIHPVSCSLCPPADSAGEIQPRLRLYRCTHMCVSVSEWFSIFKLLSYVFHHCVLYLLQLRAVNEGR